MPKLSELIKEYPMIRPVIDEKVKTDIIYDGEATSFSPNYIRLNYKIRGRIKGVPDKFNFVHSVGICFNSNDSFNSSLSGEVVIVSCKNRNRMRTTNKFSFMEIIPGSNLYMLTSGEGVDTNVVYYQKTADNEFVKIQNLKNIKITFIDGDAEELKKDEGYGTKG